MQTTLEMILKEGYAAVTTDKIAEQAKVNISSLYQYFPNKISIVQAIYEREAAELAVIIRRVMQDETDTPIEAGLQRIVENLVDFIGSRQIIFLRLEREVQELSSTVSQLSIDNMVYQSSYVYLKHHLPDVDESEIHARLFYCRHIVVALVYGFFMDEPAEISREEFVSRLSVIVKSCLKQGFIQ